MQRQGHVGKGHVKTEAETRVMHPRAKDRKGLPTTTRDQEEERRDPPPGLSEPAGPAHTLMLDF